MIQLTAGLGIALALVTGGGYLYVKALWAEQETLEQAYSIAAQTAVDNQKALDAELAERARVEKLLVTRQTKLATLEASNARLNRALDALKSDPQVRDWAATPVPDSVARLLNDATGGNQSSEAVPKPAVSSGDALP